MSLQYTYDTEGKPVGVFIPLNEWEKITVALRKEKKKPTVKKSSVDTILKGFKQVNLIEKGKLKPISIKQLLDEL
jgi:hypothetical protein